MNTNIYFDKWGNIIKPFNWRRVLAWVFAILGIIAVVRYVSYLFFIKNEERNPTSKPSPSNENDSDEPKIKY